MTIAQSPIVTIDAPRNWGRLRTILGWFDELNQPIALLSTFDRCAIVTFVLLFLYAGTTWYLTIPIRAMSLCAIFIPTLRRSHYVWYAVLVFLVAANFYDRFLIDNHKYLMTYWVLAIFLASMNQDPAARDRILAFNGRILLGLCFGFAVFAKLISSDYLHGGFFRYTLLFDGRFASFTWLATGIDRFALADTKAAAHDLRTAYVLGTDIRQVSIVSSTRLSILVWFMTCWTMVIESSIAVAFLWPGTNKVFEWGRRYLLWIFLISTYSVALVSGFAWTLTVMGLAQLPKSHARFRIIYILLVAVVLQFYEIHYVSLFRGLYAYFHQGQ